MRLEVLKMMLQSTEYKYDDAVPELNKMAARMCCPMARGFGKDDDGKCLGTNCMSFKTEQTKTGWFGWCKLS